MAKNIHYDNRDIAHVMSSSRADPCPWVFKYIYKSVLQCTGWGYLNV